jgi:peptidoglycan/LPS O-acetylase OafA/YrhL
MSMLLTAVSAAGDFLALVPAQIPDPDPIQPPGTEGLNSIMGWGKWVALAICVLGLFAAGALMAVQSRRGEGGDHVGKIGMSLGGVIVISAAAALVGFLSGA